MSGTGSYASLNGQRIVSGRITIPWYGIWVADFVLATSQTLAAASAVTIGGLSLTGTAFRAASFAGSNSARVVGGALGWRKAIGAQAYQNPGGVRLSMVLGDAAAAVGETVNIAADQTLGTFYVREAAPAQRLLRQLCGPAWWIDTSGVTQIGATRSSAPITSPWDLIDASGGKGLFHLATETISDWMPGRTFTDPNIPGTQTIGLTEITLGGDGMVRLAVLTTP